ncbi:hypothetical protein MP638_005239 [Amoeboaphelidium occidentale]|nr:hypothetical protein MP638_005239 [Amoeboaphelidium occidentale]
MKIVAVVRKPSELIALDCISSHPLKNTIKYSTVMEQWQNYRNSLATFVDELIELPELPQCPDSCFVEDLMVVAVSSHHGGAVLNRMGAPLRRQESESAKEVLEQLFSKNKLKLNDMRQCSSSNSNSNSSNKETVDGGDCLFTEKHLFVGLSRRTNLEGYEYLKNVFSSSSSSDDDANANDDDKSVKVVPIKVPENDKNKLKLNDMRQCSSSNSSNKETVDGGDCLFTEKHLFVGLSRRTNLEGYEYLKNVFSSSSSSSSSDDDANADDDDDDDDKSVKVVPIKVPENELHLKGLMSYIHPLNNGGEKGKGTLVLVDNEDGREVYEELIKVISKEDYNILFVGDLISCNVLSIPHRNVVLVSDNCQKTVELYKERLKGYKVVTLDSSELVKADGRLTCQSVLITLKE